MANVDLSLSDSTRGAFWCDIIGYVTNDVGTPPIWSIFDLYNRAVARRVTTKTGLNMVLPSPRVSTHTVFDSSGDQGR